MDPTWTVKNLKPRQLVAIPLILAIFFGAVLLLRWHRYGEPVPLSIDFKGGTIIFIRGLDNAPDVNQVEAEVKGLLGAEVSAKVVEIPGLGAQRYGLDLEMGVVLGENEREEVKRLLADRFGENISFRSTWKGPTITGIFKEQAWKALVGAFIAMAVILLIAFKHRFTTGIIITCVLLNILGSLGLMAIFGVNLSIGSIAGVLMIIGYSVDTNILLSNHVFKRYGGEIRARISNAMRTGLMMGGTTLAALGAIIAITTAALLYELATALSFGVLTDLVNTWFFNAGALVWYSERKRRKEYYVSE